MKVHRSHISSKRANVMGWSRVPPPEVRAETYSMAKGGEISMSYGMTTGAATEVLVNWDYYYPYSNTTFDGGYMPSVINIKEKEVTKEMNKRSLFKVYVVDPRRKGKLLLEQSVIAENENQAMMKSDLVKVAGEAGLDLDQVDVYAELIDTFIRARKETQRVKIAKDEED